MMTTEYSGDPSICVVPNSDADFVSTGKETLYGPRQGQDAVLPADLLTQCVTLASSGLRDTLEPVVGEKTLNQRKANIKEVKRVCCEVEMEGKRFFVSHVWNKTHEGQDFGAKIASTYCLIRVHNTVITTTGNDINYKMAKTT
jgi:hypothetical protein